MYVGVIMGAGFASGRECWQYFGVFGKKGYLGLVLAMLCFIVINYMLTYIAISRNTRDFGEIVTCFDSSRVKSGVGIVIAAVYYSMIVAMTAAGGSLLNQQFGISKAVGGILIAAMVAATVFGGFERVSGIFSKIVPVLFSVGVVTILLVIFSGITQSGQTSGFKPGEMTPDWISSALVFVSYNTLGIITMTGGCAMDAKTGRDAYRGGFTGMLLLGILTLLLMIALQKDMAFSSSLDLPMLGYSLRISKVLNVFYALILFGAVYSTAAGTYYGFSTKLPEGRWKKPVMLAGVIIGFLLGLTGFKSIVEYLYSLQGYLGMAILIMMTVNFFRERKKNRAKRLCEQKNK